MKQKPQVVSPIIKVEKTFPKPNKTFRNKLQALCDKIYLMDHMVKPISISSRSGSRESSLELQSYRSEVLPLGNANVFSKHDIVKVENVTQCFKDQLRELSLNVED